MKPYQAPAMRGIPLAILPTILSRREMAVFRKYLGLGRKKETIASIARHYGISDSRGSQIIRTIFRTRMKRAWQRSLRIARGIA